MLRVDFVLRRELTMLTQTAGNAIKRKAPKLVVESERTHGPAACRILGRKIAISRVSMR
jgi:hypothetical protein